MLVMRSVFCSIEKSKVVKIDFTLEIGKANRLTLYFPVYPYKLYTILCILKGEDVGQGDVQ